jgi:hypothetical protein
MQISNESVEEQAMDDMIDIRLIPIKESDPFDPWRRSIHSNKEKQGIQYSTV